MEFALNLFESTNSFVVNFGGGYLDVISKTDVRLDKRLPCKIYLLLCEKCCFAGCGLLGGQGDGWP